MGLIFNYRHKIGPFENFPLCSNLSVMGFISYSAKGLGRLILLADLGGGSFPIEGPGGTAIVAG